MADGDTSRRSGGVKRERLDLAASARAAALRRQEEIAGLGGPRAGPARGRATGPEPGVAPQPAGGGLHDVAAFLALHPPFSDLDADMLATICAGAAIEFFAAGTTILSPIGDPARFLYVVRIGSVEVLDGDDVVDVLDAGESFGHQSLLTAAPAAFTARAREDALCYLLPADLAMKALASAAGVRYVASTLRKRLTWAEERARSPGGGLRSARAAALLSGDPLVVGPDATVQEAARAMAEADRSSILVANRGGGHGVLTDSDLRERVVATGASSETPVAAVVTASAPTVPHDRPALEVLIALLESGAHHCVVVDARGRALGVISQAELLEPSGSSPLAVCDAVSHARDLDQLARAAKPLPGTVVALVDAGVEPLDVMRIVAAGSDAILRRLLGLAEEELGAAPVRWAWIGLGSEARREQTLVTDQDNALAYEGEEAEVDDHFERLAAFVNDGLARCGFRACRAGVMARNREWRRPLGEWLDLYRACVRDPRHARLATILFDFRVLEGDLDAGTELAAVVREAAANGGFVSRLARTAGDFKPPTGFLREFVVEADGAHRGTLDIKKRGTVPIVDIARALAVAAGSGAISTTDRLLDAERAELLEGELGAALREAFSIVCKVRLEHQAALVENGLDPDDRVDPRQLPPLARRQLKEAFHVVATVQRSVQSRRLPVRGVR